MIKICITIPEAADAALLKIEAGEVDTLHIETEEHNLALQRCKYGACLKRFVRTEPNQVYCTPEHQVAAKNDKARKSDRRVTHRTRTR